MNEIQLRIIELESALGYLKTTPKRFQSFKHSEEIATIEGEIKGLRWVLTHCFNTSEPNIIEQ